MHPSDVVREAKALEPRLKSALYGCFERVHATKAALYLATSSNGDESRFQLVTSYQYNVAGRDLIDAKDAVVSRMLSVRKPLVINSLKGEERIADVLFRQKNERLLAIPIFGRGRRMVGIIDLRDKLAKKDFDKNDVAEAEAIAQEIIGLLAEKQLYGVGPISLVDPPKQPIVAEAAPLASKQHMVMPDGPQPLSARAREAIRMARERMQRRGLAFESRKRILTKEELERVSVFLPAALAIPGAIACVLTTIARGTPQVIVSSGPAEPHVLAALRMQVAKWMRRTVSMARAPLLSYVGTGREVSSARMKMVASAYVAPRAADGLVLTVAFETTPDEAARAQFVKFVDTFGDTMSAVIGRNELLAHRYAIAERLLEPDFQKFPGLSDHCRLVAGIAERFATALKLPPETIETVRVSAFVHDVALRLLDYEQMAGRPQLTPEYREALNEHPLIGATLIEPLLGGEIAEAVLHHHERWDGSGYPAKIAGNKIPLASRVIAIADAWAAMTSSWAYPTEIEPGDAAARLREAAGTQFDPELVAAFLEKVAAITE